jgi:hypothetical protein
MDVDVEPRGVRDNTCDARRVTFSSTSTSEDDPTTRGLSIERSRLKVSRRNTTAHGYGIAHGLLFGDVPIIPNSRSL